MRRRLAITVFAATAMVVIAFVLPLGYLVRRVAEDRAINAATARARAIGPILAGQGAAEVREAVASARAEGSEPITVVLPDGEHVGSTRPVDPAALRLARRGDAFVRRLDGGVDVYQPVVTAGGSTGVVVVHVSAGRMHDGVLTSWLVLGGLGLVLSSGALVLADRIARSATRPLADVATVARRLASGEEDARGHGRRTARGAGGRPRAQPAGRPRRRAARRRPRAARGPLTRPANADHRAATRRRAPRLVGRPGPVGRRRRTPGGRGERPHRDGAARPRCDERFRSRRSRRDHAGATVVLVGRRRRADAAVRGGGAVGAGLGRRRARRAHRGGGRALVSNAVRHTPSDTAISVSLVRSGRWAELVVDDAGPGFPSPAVVERGVRGREGSGTGLGLDIARRTATAAGGRLTIGRASLGGARVAMHLPVVPAPGAHPRGQANSTFATVIRPASGGPDGSAARWWVTGTRSCTATPTSPSSTAPAIPRSWWRRRTVSA